MPAKTPFNSTGRRWAGAGFTLIELLTVIAIIGVLATLLLTTFGSVKRKAREAVCTSNLHQIGLALNLYLEDFGKRPPDLLTLASSKYIGDGRILTCPADKSSFSTPSGTTGDAKGLVAGATPTPVWVSYQHPLGWPDEQWNRLLQVNPHAGVIVCLLHDVSAPGSSATALASQTARLVLRGQLDGTVVRRQLLGSAVLLSSNDLVPSRVAAATPVASALAPGNTAAPIPVVDPPWPLFSDDPAP